MSVRFIWVGAALAASLTVGACGAGAPDRVSAYDGDESGYDEGEEAVSGADGNPPWVDAYNATLGSVLVTAVDSDGLPVARARLLIYSDSGELLSKELVPATNDSGTAVLSLQPGTYRVSARRDGRLASGRASVETGREVQLRLVLI